MHFEGHLLSKFTSTVDEFYSSGTYSPLLREDFPIQLRTHHGPTGPMLLKSRAVVPVLDDETKSSCPLLSDGSFLSQQSLLSFADSPDQSKYQSRRTRSGKNHPLIILII